MKKTGIILGLTILMILSSFSFCFAQGLELYDSSPKDGSHQSRPESLCVKLYFNEVMSSKSVQKENQNAFRFTDSKGKELPIRILYEAKRPKEIWVLVNETLESDSSYKLHISGDLADANGSTLGKDKTIVIKTRNLKTDNNVNMALMGVMMVGMVFFTSMSAKHQVKKQEEEAAAKGEAKVNPYKVAKETGKSVEDVVAKTEKNKAKARAQAEKRNKGQTQDGTANGKAAEPEWNIKRVVGPKPIAAAGSTYKTGRKALAEKEKAKAAAKAAAGTTRPKNASGKSKNKKANTSNKKK